jgi:hypothetical protein
MKNNYILIDYENVQLIDINLLKNKPVKVFVFIGAKQNKLPFEFVSSLQVLGENAEYIKISGNGSNALDFHIAFYIGKLAERDANAFFHIISKDTGFDPLIAHLKERKISIQRSESIEEIPLLQIISQEEKIQLIVKSIVNRKNARPRTVESLTNAINSLFRKELNDTELRFLVQKLDKLNYIIINDKNIIYNIEQSQLQQSESIEEIPLLKIIDQEEKIQLIVRSLVNRGNSRPRTVESLTNTINSLFRKELNDTELRFLVQKLDKLNYISINDKSVTYNIGRLQQKL